MVTTKKVGQTTRVKWLAAAAAATSAGRGEGSCGSKSTKTDFYNNKTKTEADLTLFVDHKKKAPKIR